MLVVEQGAESIASGTDSQPSHLTSTFPIVVADVTGLPWVGVHLPPHSHLPSSSRTHAVSALKGGAAWAVFIFSMLGLLHFSPHICRNAGTGRGRDA